MKIFTSLFLLFITFAAASAEQYSQSHCDALKAEKERIQDRFTRTYGISEGNYLNDRDRELFRIMRRHCVKPTPSNQETPVNRYSDSNDAQKLTSGITYNPRAINDKWSARNPTYQGEKAAAWDSFYKIPAKCRKANSSSDDFIACAEDKAEQKKSFEQYWKNRITIK